MHKTFFEQLKWLNSDANIGYGTLPIPHPLDKDLEVLVMRWADQDPKSRLESTQSLGDDQRFTMLAFSERMASRAVREHNVEYIYLGLLALGIDGWQHDWRDNATLISLHYDACLKCNTNPEAIFERAGSMLSDKVRSAFRSFLNRNQEDQTIDSMGYEESRDKDGFRYRRTW